MNVGLFADCYLPTPSGVVTSLLLLKAGLERKGHRVVVLTVVNPPWRDGGATVYRFSSLPFSRDNEWRAGLGKPRDVLRIAERERLDLIHTHTEFGLGWAGRRAARCLPVPWVHTAHTLYEEYRHYLPLGQWLPRWAVRRYLSGFLSGCHTVICPSLKLQRYLWGFLRGARTTVIPNAVDGARFRPDRLTSAERDRMRSGLRIRSEDRVLLYAGRLGREKRVLELLQALAPLLRSDTHCKAVFVGGGPLLPALRRAARRLGVSGQAILTGPIAWEDMPLLYTAADAFVTASLSENHPMTCLEALASGLPIIARRDEGYADLVRDGASGYLVDSDSAIAERTAHVLDDETRRRAFSENATALAGTFSVETHVERIESLYRQVVGRPQE